MSLRNSFGGFILADTVLFSAMGLGLMTIDRVVVTAVFSKTNNIERRVVTRNGKHNNTLMAIYSHILKFLYVASSSDLWIFIGRKG
jgi:hypothetical protein